MTQATDVDLREIKTAIEANTKAIDAIAQKTEANTKAIETIAQKTEANTRAIDAHSDRIEAIVRATEANTKAIGDLTLEMRVGFADVKGHINTVEAKLEGKLEKIDTKYDERTKLGFWGFIFRGSALAVLAALLVIFVKYLFPVLPIA
jgi:ABC-type transporter Mla subunit MlaD